MGYALLCLVVVSGECGNEGTDVTHVNIEKWPVRRPWPAFRLCQKERSQKERSTVHVRIILVSVCSRVPAVSFRRARCVPVAKLQLGIVCDAKQ